MSGKKGKIIVLIGVIVIALMATSAAFSEEKKPVTYISFFELKPGYDPEETYQVWINAHVNPMMKLMKPELKGYVIGRVVENSLGGAFYGSVRLSFDSLEDCRSALGRLRKMQAGAPDEMMKRITNITCVKVEERDVFH